LRQESLFKAVILPGGGYWGRSLVLDAVYTSRNVSLYKKVVDSLNLGVGFAMQGISKRLRLTEPIEKKFKFKIVDITSSEPTFKFKIHSRYRNLRLIYSHLKD
jgi:hypothetical protein